MDVRIQVEQPVFEKEGRGCWFYGCITLLVLVVIVIGAIAFGAWWVQNRAMNYFTDQKPLEYAEANYSPEVAKQATTKIETFSKQLADTKQPATLTLTEDEINALIAHHPDFNKSGVRAEVKFEEGTASGKISVPLDKMVESNEFKQAKGRYLNGAATLDVSTRDGRLIVYLKSLQVKGFNVPDVIMKNFRETNLAEPSNDPNHPRKEDNYDLKDITLKKGQISITAVAKTP